MKNILVILFLLVSVVAFSQGDAKISQVRKQYLIHPTEKIDWNIVRYALCFVSNGHGYFFSYEEPKPNDPYCDGLKLYLYKETETNRFDSLYITEMKNTAHWKNNPDGSADNITERDYYCITSNDPTATCIKKYSNGWVLLLKYHNIANEQIKYASYYVFYLLKPNNTPFGFEFYKFDGKNIYYTNEPINRFKKEVSDLNTQGQSIIKMDIDKQIILQFDKDSTAKFIGL